MTPESVVPTERLAVEYDPATVAALSGLHDEAEVFYPEPPPAELLERIDDVEQLLAESANGQIRAFADELRAAGKRPWFEVAYPGDEAIDPEGDGTTTVWDRSGDAVEVADDGTITTLPPYAELRGA